jgi:hypothetical protein
MNHWHGIRVTKWNKRRLTLRQRLTPYRLYAVTICISFTLGWDCNLYFLVVILNPPLKSLDYYNTAIIF